MDLQAVVADGTDGLGHPVLARYYRGLFDRYLPGPGYDGSFRTRAALNFGVQQLATRSRVSPETEGYLQVGGFDALDLPAALIEAMPHTRVTCVRPVAGTAEALARLRDALPGDGMPVDIECAGELKPARFGLIVLFPGELDDIEDWRPMLSARGTLVSIGRAEHRPPVIRIHG